MFSLYKARLQLKIKLLLIITCCLVPLLALFLTSSSAWASSQQTDAHSSNPTLQIDMGFNSTFRTGFWTPTRVKISNPGADFKGTLSVSTYSGTPSSTVPKQISPWQFTEPIMLKKNAQEQINMYIPFFLNNVIARGVLAVLRNDKGKVVATQTAVSGYEMTPGTLFIATLADSAEDFDPLISLPFPNQYSFTPASLDASTLPSMAAVLANFDIIVLDNFHTKNLRPDQLLALQTWVNQGGILIEVGGSHWQQTLEPLPASLLPVKINSTGMLPAGTQLVSTNNPIIEDPSQMVLSETLSSPVAASSATLSNQGTFSNTEVLLAAGTTPLVVQAHQGQGVICYLAVDPADPNFASWSGIQELWRLVLLRSLGDFSLISNISENYSAGPGQLFTRAGILDMVVPETLPGPFIIIAFLLGYAALLGPVRLLVIRRLKRPYWWTWRIFLACVVVFVPLSYSFATYQRYASITDNNVSIIQLNQGSSSAYVTTYSGIYVPNAGDFTLHFPGESLAQPISQQYQLNNSSTLSKKDTNTTIAENTDNTNMKLQGLAPWSLHYVLSEQDLDLHGKLISHLSIRNGRLLGTIQNTLSSALSDVYVLLAHSFVPIGHLNAGELQQVDLPLSNLSVSSGKTFADQIAQQGGLAEPYFPYTSNGSQPLTEFQRHMALLSALNGSGFSFHACNDTCKLHSITNRHTIFVTGGRVPNPGMSDYEPLVLSDASATLIGWADQPVTNGVTINDWHPIGRQENFIQTALNIDLSNSYNSPSDLITGQIYDIESYDAELTLPGIYTMTTGNVTFELSVPDKNHLPASGLTITEPDLWAHPFGPGSGSSATQSHLQALIYNWQASAWDTIALRSDTDAFTTTHPQPYIGPNGKILLQITNQDISLGKLYFGKPTLRLNSTS